MVSNSGSLMDLLLDQFNDADQDKKLKHSDSEKTEGDWTLEKIGKLLNIETEHLDQIEGNILISLFGAKSLFTFDNHTIEQMPECEYKIAFSYNSIHNGNLNRDE